MTTQASTAIPVFLVEPYGRMELRNSLNRNLIVGLMTATIIHLSAIGVYNLAQRLKEAEENIRTVRVRIMKYSELGPPPSIISSPVSPVGLGVSRSVRPSIGIPVPVPDAEINPAQTIATQQELSAVGSNFPGDANSGSGVEVSQDI